MKRSRGEIRKGKKPTVDSVTKQVDKVLGRREFMKDIFEYEVLEKSGDVYLTFQAPTISFLKSRRLSWGKLPCLQTGAIPQIMK